MLPFLEQNDLFEQYRFEEPWDSEHNLTLVPKMPEDLPYETAEDAKRAKPFPGQPLRYLATDGAVYSMDPVDWEELAKWITRDGREVIER